MSNKKLKILGLVFVLFVILLGGAIYYASTKLTPEEIKKIAITETEKVFPGAVVKLDDIKVSMGLNFKILLANYQIALKDKPESNELLKVGELQVKIPFWAILTGGGIVEIKLDSPQIKYQEMDETNNWSKALGSKSEEEKKEDAAKEENNKDAEKVNVGFLAKSKVNIRLTNIAINYQLKSNSKGNVAVSKLVINGLNVESPTAFELASNVSTINESNQETSFDLLVIGQIHLDEYLKSGNIPLDSVIKINQFSKEGMNFKVPEITTNLNVVMKKAGMIEGKFETSFESQNKISASFFLDKKIQLKDLLVDINMKDIHTILGLDNSIDMNKAHFSAKGNVEIGADKKIQAALSFDLNPGIVTSKEGVTIVTTANGEYKESAYSAKIQNKVLDGTANISVNGKLDLSEKFDLKTMPTIDVKVYANGIKLTEKFIQNKLWGDKKIEEAKQEEAKAKEIENAKNISEGGNVNVGKDVPPPTLPSTVVQIDWSAINVGGQDFSGKGKIAINQNSVAIDNLGFKFGKGTGKLSQVATLNKNSNDSKFNFEIANLNLESFKAFLPPFVENFRGDFTGKVHGTASMSKKGLPPQYDVNADLSVKKGEIKKLNITDYVNPVLTGLPVVKEFYKGDKELKINGDFETLTLTGKFDHKNYAISKFSFIGIGNKVEINGSGNISPISTGNSLMEVNFTDNSEKIGPVLQKNTGSKILPLRLSGLGFSLKPEVSYTVSKLAKGAFKAKEEKVKEVIKDKLNDVLKSDDAKKKVNNLLKGLFK